MSIPDQDTLLEKLQSLKEVDLAKRIIIPLLHTQNFDSIESRHGAGEKGTDILCVKKDEIGELDLLSVQVKRLEFSGKAPRAGHLHGVFNQLSQCMDEPIKLGDGTERRPNRIWLVSPYPLNASALEQGFSKYTQSKINRIQIVDGPRLLRLIRERAPGLLGELGDPFAAYICTVRDEVAILKEAAALRLSQNVSLLPIYVNLDLSLLSDKVAAVVGEPVKAGQRKEATTYMLPQDIVDTAQFNSTAASLLGVAPIYLELGPDAKNQLSADIRTVSIHEVDIVTGPPKAGQVKGDLGSLVQLRFEEAAFRQAVRTRTQRRLVKLRKALERGTGKSTSALLDFYSYIRTLEQLMEFRILRGVMGPARYVARPPLEYERTSLAIDVILDSRLNYQVVGDAGTGKTTLLRLLAHTQLGKGDRIPVFVPLSAMTPQHGLLGITYQSCKSSGYGGSKESLERLIRSGDILLLLDGLDEAIRRVPDIQDMILDFLREFPRTQLVITTRPWAAIQTSAVGCTVRILPFTPQQSEQFFRNWFHDRLDQAQLMVQHIKKNPNLSDAAATPLLASVLAVILSVGGKLPTSLLGLYEERFRLLLHDWDAVKGIRRDQFDVADKQFFLRKLAQHLHSKSIRATSWSDMVAVLRNNVGRIESAEEADWFLTELIRNNNVICSEPNDKWSLGHLQYQEYQAALELKENRRLKLDYYMGSGWWSKVMEMYADMTRDITPIYDGLVARYGVTWSADHPEILRQLYALLRIAPNTDHTVRRDVQKEWEYSVAVQKSFDTYQDADVIAGRGRPR